MKIADVKTFVVGNPPPHFGGRYWIFLKLTTDGGVEGVGEVYSVPFHPHTVARMIEDVCGRCVIGADPFKIERLWRIVYSSGYTQRPDTSIMGILSGVEMACWDIVGKELGKPVYELLGGQVHEKLRSYTYLYPEETDGTDVYTDPDLAADRAAEYVGLGFTAVKFDPVGPYTAFDPRQLSLEALELSERFVGTVREAVGAKCDLLVGTHGQMTASGAIRLARRLEKYDPLWLEEPTPPENPDEMARVARQTSIPIATGERLATKYEFARILERQAASILQMALGRVGGILEAKKIAGMAETYYAQIAPHLYCGPIEGAANI
ncbi:MAG: mandelate racemase/muconate lactonizing enzyme family protein, partial [Kiloniellaceae bacterium]